ncbi:MAG TPA: sigma-54 dependent transcriptional regulator [Thermoanaerobaculia bacterium]|nr:sigma-54 dependent transcriptional regulator [Thermoanaerobaculia bacterium]
MAAGGVGEAASSVLVVEDRESLRRMLERALGGEGYQVGVAADGEEGIRRLEERPWNLVLTDLKLPGCSGLEVLAQARRLHPATPVVVLTAYGTVATAVEAMKLGAADFLEKPLELDELFEMVRSHLGVGAGTEAPPEVFRAGPGAPPIVGRHPRLRAALRLLERVAPTETTVLLTGESGTGKELFAHALHVLSPRRDGPFVAVNCAAIPETLMENELFGHERGAFTGAHRREPGRFARAQGGTLFLDEIGELSPAVQGKILRVLEERVYERVGSATPQHADVRLVAATNRGLRQMVDAGEFRSDLFFRLDVFPIELPPLRERASDVASLVEHLLRHLGERHGLAPPQLTDRALELLADQPWPGNVRQLANVLERALILHPDDRLGARQLGELLQRVPGGEERQAIREALLACDGDKHRAAERLGISYRTLLRKVRQHDLAGFPRYRQE